MEIEIIDERYVLLEVCLKKLETNKHKGKSIKCQFPKKQKGSKKSLILEEHIEES